LSTSKVETAINWEILSLFIWMLTSDAPIAALVRYAAAIHAIIQTWRAVVVSIGAISLTI